MGQDYSLITLSAASANIDIPELADISYEKSLGNARFMKCVRARHRDGLVVAKLIVKPYAIQSNGQRDVQDVGEYVDKITRQEQVLSEVPNTLSYHRIVNTETSGYFLRQYIRSSLYDRISTRPFLEPVEKKWMAFQLLCALRDCHARDIFHGDIKTENVLVTSFSWLYLADFSSPYKPTYLPENNPAKFSFYFDTSGRRTCYLAPERFLADGDEPTYGSVTAEMDIFSAGCVIAELFLETHIFELHHMLKYRDGEYDPLVSVNRIADKGIRELVAHMIQKQPEARFSAEQYLREWTPSTFPTYFGSFLHDYMHSMVRPAQPGARRQITTGAENMGESDSRIERVYADFGLISSQLGYDKTDKTAVAVPPARPTRNQIDSDCSSAAHIDIPHPRHRVDGSASPDSDDGTLIFLNLILSSIRSTARTSSRLAACDLLLAFAERVTDEAKLDRIVPFLVSLFNDRSDSVRVAALRTVCRIVGMVRTISAVHSYIFPDYLLPHFQAFLLDHQFRPSSFVRASYATCVSSLAATAARYLDLADALRSDRSESVADTDPVGRFDRPSLFDSSRLELVAEFEEQVKIILSDPDPSVRRAFLGSVPPLCIFFGTSTAIDVMLRHMNTYLNDRDWRLKCAFFDTIVAVAAFVGSSSLEDYILPLMVQALADPEEFVIERVIRSFNALAQLGLFQRPKTVMLLEAVCKFTVHPNLWIRDAACQFIASASSFLSMADYYTIVVPLTVPYIVYFPTEKKHVPLLNALKPPLSRVIFTVVMNWASLDPNSRFWSVGNESRSEGPSEVDNLLRRYNSNKYDGPLLSKLNAGPEDKQRRNQLETAYKLTREDEMKILTLHAFFGQVAHRKPRNSLMSSTPADVSPFNPTGFTVPIRTIDFFPSAHSVVQSSRSVQSLETPLDQLSLGLSNSGTPAESVVAEDDGPNGQQQQSSQQSARRGSDASNATRDSRLMTASMATSAMTGTTMSAMTVLPRHVHSYRGRDPTVLRLLDKLFLANVSIHDRELGPRIPVRDKNRAVRSNQVQDSAAWRPQGELVSMLAEHTGPINRLAVSPDHSFFVSVSDDGSARVWDISRLERHVSNRSRVSWCPGAGIRLTGVAFVDQTNSFACTGDDGSVTIVRMEPSKTRTSQFGKLEAVRRHQLPTGQMGVAIDHYRTDSQSVLLVLTSKGILTGLDVNDMKVRYRLQNPGRHGFATCFVIDHLRHWAIVGTDHGVLDLWDLRFSVLVKSWAFEAGAPIHRLSLAPISGSKENRLFVAGGIGTGAVTVWDIEKVACREAFLPSSGMAMHPNSGGAGSSTGGNGPTVGSGNNGQAQYQLHDITNAEHSVCSRFALDSSSPQPDIDHGARALVVGAHLPVDGSASRKYFVVSAGADWKIRFWDLNRKHSSCLVSGLKDGEPEPKYSVEQANPIGSGPVIIRESVNRGLSRPTFGRAVYRHSGRRAANASHPGSGSAVGSSGSHTPTHAARGHVDSVTDIILLENPYGMIVSADRSGVIYVYA